MNLVTFCGSVRSYALRFDGLHSCMYSVSDRVYENGVGQKLKANHQFIISGY
jgi:hypothetical protein